MIKPTIGRKLYYRPLIKGSMHNVIDPAQPLDATIVYVHSDDCVNLHVIDHAGNTYFESSVFLFQDDEPKPEGGHFCHWMPFQVGQAKAQAST